MNRRSSNEKGEPDAPDRTRTPLPEWLAVRLDLPPDLFAGGFRAELRGRHSLTVHGVRRIALYTPERITLTVKGGDVTVAGQRLICTSYLAGAVGIDGHIDSLTVGDGQTEGEAET